MIIADHDAGDANGRAGVVAAGQGSPARFQRHGDGEDLEGGAHFIDPQRGAVEALVRIAGGRLGGVKLGQRNHGQDLAVTDILHDGGTAAGAKLRHGTA